MPIISICMLSFLLAFIDTLMVYIYIDELLPTAHQYGYSHCFIFGLPIGMFIMAVSLLIL